MLPSGHAIVLQQCGQYRRAEKLKERLIRAQTTKVKEYLVKAKAAPLCHSRNAALGCGRHRIAIYGTRAISSAPEVTPHR